MNPVTKALSTCIVVPCYNEAQRLSQDEFRVLLEAEDISLLFVDDGSTDNTLEVLEAFAEESEKISVLGLSPNRGKAEAVRRGLVAALEGNVDHVGFIDADMATPVEEVIRLAQRAGGEAADVIIGSRISYLGTDIDRSMKRHLLGRVFATAASLALDAKVYDTQCGAKFFRNSDVVRGALAEPFHSRWAFDVELLGRLLDDGAHILEVPLRRWVDVPGSKIGFKSMLKAGLDLAQIRTHLAKRRK